MELFKGISNLMNGWFSGAHLPKVGAGPADQQFTPDQLEAFIEHFRDTQRVRGEGMLFARDIENIFARANIHSSWQIASSNLAVFQAGLQATGHSGICLWFDRTEHPSGIVYGEKVLECVTVNPRGERCEVLHRGAKVGDGYGMPGWAGTGVAIVGWLVMVDTHTLD
jgi:hypothetical protein